MHKIVAVAMLVMVAVAAVITQAQDLQYPEREVVARLAAQILRVTGASVGPSAAAAPPRKRNAELINSLLGIPKIMTDAGRR